jgi:hypothetical protein
LKPVIISVGPERTEVSEGAAGGGQGEGRRRRKRRRRTR